MIPAQALDVNDVSILFPLPREKDEISKLIPINFQNSAGVSPMTPELFKDILDHHKYKVSVDGKSLSVNSGSLFEGERRGKPGKIFGPYNLIEDWKIVAMRYDACAPTVEHNLRLKPPTEVRKVFDDKACHPQMRLTAQPILDASREETEFSGKVVAGDYAIHMLFFLSPEQSRELYGELVQFKMGCGDLTSSVPLNVHPCLKAEINQGVFAGNKFQIVSSLIKKYAQNYLGTAMLATAVGTDPWSFMNGKITNGKFEHVQIDAVKEDDPAKLKRNSQGALLEPFLNGYFQQLSFVEVPHNCGGNPDCIEAISKPTRVTPIAKSNKINAELSLEAGTSGFDAEPEVIKKIAEIENPLRNDFFSTDCVSCHVASARLDGPARTWKEDTLSYRVDDWDTGDYGWSQTNIFSDQDDIRKLVRAEPAQFHLENGYTNVNDLYVTPRNINSMRPYALVHFGYFGAKPSVSARTANESALVAKMANTFYGQGIQPRAVCATEALRQCLQGMNFYRREAPSTFPLSACMQKVCPVRAKELQSYFGPDAYLRYRATRDLKVLDFSSQKPTKSVLAKGTEIFGRFLKPDDSNVWQFDSPEFIPVKGPTKSLYFYGENAVPMIPKGEHWNDYFEPIKD